ncbi:MAG: diguanylate cyclase [Clostridia bacterium]|nr:diguanylate cyclase [Clostridia bacterium]
MKDMIFILILTLITAYNISIIFLGYKKSWTNVLNYKYSYMLAIVYNVNLILSELSHSIIMEKSIPIISLFFFRQLIIDFYRSMEMKISNTIKIIWFHVTPLVFLFFVSVDILRGIANKVGVSGDIGAYDLLMIIGVILYQLSVFVDLFKINYLSRKDSLPRYQQVYLAHMLVNFLFVFITLGVFISKQIEENIIISGLLFTLYLIFLTVNYIRPEWLPHAYTVRLMVHDHQINKEKTVRSRDRRSLDGLTGVFTREYFLRYIETLDTNDDALSIILMQMTGLKLINESFGFDVGDEIVQKNSVIICDLFPNATVARMTGSLFAIMTSKESEEEISQKIRKIKELSNSNQDYIIHLNFGYYMRKNEDLLPLDVYLRSVEELYYNRLIINQKHQNQIADMLVKNQSKSSVLLNEHLERCAHLASMFGEFLKLSDEEICDIRNGALLHDIALVKMPTIESYHVSFSDDFEKRVYESHVSKGYDIAIESGINPSTAQGILHHHEKYNGSGYPHGLKGEAIPFVAQVICLIDHIDIIFNTGKKIKKVRDHLISKIGVEFSSEMVYNMIAFLEEEGMIEADI